MRRDSEIIFLPTDTCYGVGCHIYHAPGHDQIFSLKGRWAHKRLCIVVDTWSDLEKTLDLTQEQLRFLQLYPHPFTIVAKPQLWWKCPDHIDRNLYDTIGVRVAECCLDDAVRSQISEYFPLFLTSANISGEPECFSYNEVCAQFIDTYRIIDGSCGCKQPSDVFRFEGDTLRTHYFRNNHESHAPKNHSQICRNGTDILKNAPHR